MKKLTRIQQVVKDNAQEMRLAGLSYREIARRLGITSESTVRKAFIKLGMTEATGYNMIEVINTKGEKVLLTQKQMKIKDEVMTLISQGMGIQKVGTMVNACPSTIKDTAIKMGVYNGMLHVERKKLVSGTHDPFWSDMKIKVGKRGLI